MTTTTIELAGHDEDRVAVSSADLDHLEERIAGAVLHPDDAGWDDAVLIWNGMVARTPSLVIQPVSADDVGAVVDFAVEHGLALGVKGGGHNIAGTSMVEAGLVLDMSVMRDVEVDADAKLVHVGPGCLLKHVDAGTQRHGLATVLGFVSETGVAGLTLGGGFGYLSRRHGYTVDNLEEVEIVTADGATRIANRDREPDLFWAVRGGGGNFGVVTRFTFRLHEVGPTITGGLIVWPAERASEVLRVYRDVTGSAPRELTIATTIRRAPAAPFLPEEWHGEPIIGVVVCHTGEDPAADLKPLRDLGGHIVDLVVDKPYVEQQAMLDATQPKGLHYYWKTEYFSELDDRLLEAFRDHALQVTSPLSQSLIFHVGGALNEHDVDDGAVGNRDARYIGGFAGAWPPDVEDAEHVAWARQGWEAIRDFSTGGNYINFQLADDDEERVAAAYGPNFERLQRLKERFDPANVFRANRNVSPAS